jgi:ribonuclease BN (tRNA processing enzyme)
MIRGADVLLHDAQFLESERSTADLFGHATVDEAIALADEAGVRTLILFHHGPTRTDDQLDAIASSIDAPMNVLVAVEGQMIDVRPEPAVTP